MNQLFILLLSVLPFKNFSRGLWSQKYHTLCLVDKSLLLDM